MIKLPGATVYAGNNLDILPTLPDNSVDAIVTDPPYELGFMGKKWDNSGIAYSVELWTECLRVLKPGGHLLSFGGTRTWHRVAVAIEDAGFEVRDSMAWLYGSGFPKSLDVSKAIDKAVGAERQSLGANPNSRPNSAGNKSGSMGGGVYTYPDITAPATPEAKQWQGWGTALKPAFEPIVVARKPLIGTVAENVLTHGTGGLNIDGSRIGTEQRTNQPASSLGNGQTLSGGQAQEDWQATTVQGRWPSNVLLDDYTAGLVDEQSGISVSKQALMGAGPESQGYNLHKRQPSVRGHNDSGGASRFFYVAKASKRDRNEGLDHLPDQKSQHDSGGIGRQVSVDKRLADGEGMNAPTAKNIHPTVKPTDLMRYLIKLVTPPNGIVLDPFTGSGSTGKAAILEGFEFIGIEMTEEYLPIIEGRLKWAIEQASKQKEKESEALF